MLGDAPKSAELRNKMSAGVSLPSRKGHPCRTGASTRVPRERAWDRCASAHSGGRFSDRRSRRRRRRRRYSHPHRAWGVVKFAAAATVDSAAAVVALRRDRAPTKCITPDALPVSSSYSKSSSSSASIVPLAVFPVDLVASPIADSTIGTRVSLSPPVACLVVRAEASGGAQLMSSRVRLAGD
jgi:hypothetical protein